MAEGDGRDDDSEALFYVLYKDGNSFSPQPQPKGVGSIIISIYKATEDMNNLSKIRSPWWSCGQNPRNMVQNQCSYLQHLEASFGMSVGLKASNLFPSF